MTLRWTRAAIADLAAIQDYIAKERPASARRVAAEILEQVESLVTNPLRGRVGRIEGTRELIIGRYPYMVPYRVHGKEIQLLGVLHERRNWPAE
jgi:addiction module RelE/StbE family toxin